MLSFETASFDKAFTVHAARRWLHRKIHASSRPAGHLAVGLRPQRAAAWDSRAEHLHAPNPTSWLRSTRLRRALSQRLMPRDLWNVVVALRGRLSAMPKASRLGRSIPTARSRTHGQGMARRGERAGTAHPAHDGARASAGRTHRRPQRRFARRGGDGRRSSVGHAGVPLRARHRHRLDAPAFKARYPSMTVMCPPGAKKQVEEVLSVESDGHCLRRSRRHVAGPRGHRRTRRRHDRDVGGGDLARDQRHDDEHAAHAGFGGFISRAIGFAGPTKLPAMTRFMLVKDRAALSADLERLADTPISGASFRATATSSPTTPQARCGAWPPRCRGYYAKPTQTHAASTLLSTLSPLVTEHGGEPATSEDSLDSLRRGRYQERLPGGGGAC